VVEEGLLVRLQGLNHLHPPLLNTLLDPMSPVLLQGGAGVEAVVAPLVVVVEEGQAGERDQLVSLGGAEEGTPNEGAPLPSRLQLNDLVSLPVGARLLSFVSRWEDITKDLWVLNIVRNGLSLTFTESPPLSNLPLPFCLPVDKTKAAVLRKEVEDMLVKRAIALVLNPFSPGYYSLIFLVPKKNGRWRPVIDLSSLNLFLQVDKFKMTTPQSIRAALSPQDYAVSLDLQDAYFHVPIHPGSWKYLRFAMEGKTYCFRALPFGIATAPQVFTRVFSVIGAFLHQRNINIVMYLDDWLIFHRDPAFLVAVVKELLPFLLTLGILLNLEKSDLTPRQRFTYIGVEFWTDLSLVLPPVDRVAKLQSLLNKLSNSNQCVARDFLSLIGMCNSMMAYIPYGRMHLRPLQWYLKDRYFPKDDLVTKIIQLDWSILRDMTRCWRSPVWLRQGAPMHLPTDRLTLVTDASRHGWGGYLERSEASGAWNKDDQSLHINALELKAVLLCLRQFEAQVRNKAVLVLSDNVTAVQYINKQGGTHSRQCNNMTVEILMWCQKRAISLLARHIVGALNVLADGLSRNEVDPKEWTLASKVTDEIFSQWGTPQVDLFANRLNFRLPSYVSPCPDRDAWNIDALSMLWTGLVAYAYPPGILLTKILEKMAVEPCELILIAPLWPARNWYPQLLSYLMEPPVQLPLWKTLLQQPRSGVYADRDCLERYNLHAWKLSSLPYAVRVFHQDLPELSPPPTELVQSDCMTVDGRSTLVGVSRGTRILSRPLFP